MPAARAAGSSSREARRRSPTEECSKAYATKTATTTHDTPTVVVVVSGTPMNAWFPPVQEVVWTITTLTTIRSDNVAMLAAIPDSRMSGNPIAAARTPTPTTTTAIAGYVPRCRSETTLGRSGSRNCFVSDLTVSSPVA
jgi:hypothetical protein